MKQRVLAAAILLLLLRADMYPDAGNAKLPEAQQNLGITAVSTGTYGSKGDRQDLAGALTVAAGGTAATVSGGAFTAADTGKIILIAGAGTSGAAHLTTIAAVSSPTAIILALAATTAVTSASFSYASNDVAAINAAIADAHARYPAGARVVIPAGKYLINPAVSRVTLASNLVLDGDGAADIRCADNHPTTSKACIFGDTLTSVEIRGLIVKGLADLTTARPLSDVEGMLHVFNSTGVRIRNNRLSYARNYTAHVTASTTVDITDNIASYGLSGGLGCGGCLGDVIISRNHVDHHADAIFPISVGDAQPAPSGLRGVVVNDNVSTDSVGVQVSGGRSITISGNSFTRMRGQAIWVNPWGSFNAGNTPHSAVAITGNTILDVVNAAPGTALNTDYSAYMVLGGGGPRNKGGGAAFPGYPATGTGAVADYFGANSTGYFFNNNTDAVGVTSPGSIAWLIADNVMVRTLPAVADYSQWGYGPSMWSAAAGNAPYTGPIAEADLNLSCINIREQPLRHSVIRNNLCATTGAYGVQFTNAGGAYTALDGDYDGLTISDNKFIDYKSAGIFINPAVSITSQMIVERNEFNADPRFVSTNRGAGGTWLAFTGPHGIFNGKIVGMQVDGNHFRNLAVPIGQASAANLGTLGPNNVIYGAPVAAGFNTGNVGVGTAGAIAGQQGQFRLVHEDGVPASATFGKQLTAGGQTYAAIPTTGVWLAGTMIWKQAPTLDPNGRVLLGWMRITTGANNVDGTDWRAVYGSATTAAGGFIFAGTTVGALPTCNSFAKFTTYGVTDALAPAWNATVAGAGAIAVPVMCDGAAWKVR